MNRKFSIEKYLQGTVPHPNGGGESTDFLIHHTQNAFRNAHRITTHSHGVRGFDPDDDDLEPPCVVDANGRYILPQVVFEQVRFHQEGEF